MAIQVLFLSKYLDIDIEPLNNDIEINIDSHGMDSKWEKCNVQQIGKLHIIQVFSFY